MAAEKPPTVALISEYPPPAAGMTVLAEEYYSRLKNDGYPILKIRTNPELGVLAFINKIPVFKTIFKWCIFLIHCIKIFKADTVHIFSSSGLNFLLFTLAPLVLAKLMGKQVIINYHGGAAKQFFLKHPRLLKYSMKNSCSLVVPSGYLQDIFKEFGYDSLIIPNIANVKRFTFRKRDTFRPAVLSIRNLTPVYNIQCAVRAFSILQDKYPDAKMYIIGDGPERENIINLINQLNLKNIELTGNIANNEVPHYFDIADILINTSNVDNMPGSILEAYASGIPVVSTNVGGIPYMVKHGESGLLADADDYQRIGENLLKVIENQEDSRRMVENGFKYLTTLNWEPIKASWLELYKSCS